MKRNRIAIALTALLLAGAMFAGCSAKGGTANGADGAFGNSGWSGNMSTGGNAGMAPGGDANMAPDAGGGYGEGGVADGEASGDFETGGNYHYGSIYETPFTAVDEENNSSYFSLDRNTACYSYVRSQIENEWTIYPDSIRIEEMINYFDYSYPEPTDEAISVSTYLTDCPWNAGNKLITVGVKTQTVELDATNGNYVLLIDVSGSMSGKNRIGLAQKGFNMLVDSLGEGDVASVVKYASGMDVVVDGIECTAKGKEKVKNAVNKLNAYGSTNGAGGLELAYRTAQKHFIEGGNNRVILVSDGDFNVGSSTVDAMKEFIQEKAKSGIYLSVIGVGMGNTRDDMLETLATCGNGNYGYMDNETEARKIFLKDIGGMLKTVAKDAKAGVTFTDSVEKFRLIGYDTKHMTQEEFDNAQTDAGEIGSGLCSTAVYEVTLKEGAAGEIATAEVRYKDVRGEGEINSSVTSAIKTDDGNGNTIADTVKTDLQFITCVAEFGLILRQSKYKADASVAGVLQRLSALSEALAVDPFKEEFIKLVGKYSEKNK